MSEDELAIFDLVEKKNLTGAERERVKRASRDLLTELLRIIEPLEQWTEKEQTRAEVETFILDKLYLLPEPPYSTSEKDAMAQLVYQHVWQQSVGGHLANREPIRAGHDNH